MLIPKDIPFGIFTRTIGALDSREVIGAGFMHKAGNHNDHVDYDPPNYSLVYVISGEGDYVDSSGKWYHLTPGCYLQRIPGCKHSSFVEPNGEWRECFIDLGPRMCEALIGMRIIDPERPTGKAGASQGLVDEFAMILREIRKSSDFQLPTLLPRMLDLQQRILGISQPSKPDQTRETINKACLVLSHDLEQRIDLREMCRENGWGYEKFRKDFQDATGISPGNYRIRCRMDKARGLLKSSDMPIGQIAESLGYSNIYEFSAQFKKNAGISPRQFRAS